MQLKHGALKMCLFQPTQLRLLLLFKQLNKKLQTIHNKRCSPRHFYIMIFAFRHTVQMLFL
jgi:hypothetical protein